MPETAPAPANPRRILIIEDEDQVCELLRDMVAGEGFEPDCVQSDQAAYDALRVRKGYACLIVDVNLGRGATGYDVARFARRIAGNLPVIYVSGQTTEASHRANGVPGSLFVAKPFTAPELLERIRMLVGDNDD
jgi:DNA-binding response OmpR family regulator